MHPLHRSHINHDAAVDSAAPSDVVPTAADGDLEIELASYRHRIDDVRRPMAPRDDRRPLVDQPVVHPPGLVVLDIGGLKKLTRKRWRDARHESRNRHRNLHQNAPTRRTMMGDAEESISNF